MKTYKADSMYEALQMVQQDLGPDAVVVSARECPAGPLWNPWSKKGVEIVASQANLPKKANKSETLKFSQSDGNARLEFLSEERPDIEWDSPPGDSPGMPVLDPKKQWKPGHLSRQEMEAANALLHQGKQSSEETTWRHNPNVRPVADQDLGARQTETQEKLPAGLEKIGKRLLEQELDERNLDRLLHLAAASFSPRVLADGILCRKMFIELLEAELPAVPSNMRMIREAVICLVGASGSGKTTCMAKLALLLSHSFAKKVVWISADTHRTGAIAEARAFTDALGIELKLVYSPADFAIEIGEIEKNCVYLVDTPGFNPYREEQIVELGAYLSTLPKKNTYLVASAQTKASDLNHTAAVLGLLHLDGVVVTRLDETSTYGNVFNFSRAQRLPLIYFGFGKQVSGTLQAGDNSRLVAALFGKKWH